MGLVTTSYITITCGRKECGKTITYEASQEEAVLSLPENLWVNNGRIVTRLKQTPEQRARNQRPESFFYCGDECEVLETGTGVHNLPVVKTIATATNAEQIAAAASAARAAAATKALKEGTGITLG